MRRTAVGGPQSGTPITVVYAAAGMVTGRSRYPTRYASAAGPLLLSHCAVCAARRLSPFAMRGRLLLFPTCGSGPWLALSVPLDLEEEEREREEEGGRGVLLIRARTGGRKGGEEGEGWWGPQGQNRLFTLQLTVHG